MQLIIYKPAIVKIPAGKVRKRERKINLRMIKNRVFRYDRNRVQGSTLILSAHLLFPKIFCEKITHSWLKTPNKPAFPQD